MPLTIIVGAPNDTSQKVLRGIRDDGATELSRVMGIPGKYCHTYFPKNLLQGNSGPEGRMIFGLVITGFFRPWPWQKAVIKESTEVLATVISLAFDSKIDVEVFPFSVRRALSTLIRVIAQKA